MGTFHEHLVQRLVDQLESHPPEEREAIRSACKFRDGTRIVPFIGSGISSLAPGAQGSWAALVADVRRCSGSSIPDYGKTEILLPEQLELYLHDVEPSKRRRVTEAFDRAYGNSLAPAAIHGRLVSSFNYIVTLNYDHLLEAAARDRGLRHRTVDVTEPSAEPEKLLHPSVDAIVHLHGEWPVLPSGLPPAGIDAHKRTWEERIFSFASANEAPQQCLILTDHQYHRLYFSSYAFRKKLNLIFTSAAFFLFMGVGMSPSEYALHHFLRENRLSGGPARLGAYVGFAIDAAKQQLLRHRGLIPFSLPTEYGVAPLTREAALHAFLDALDKFAHTSFCAGRDARDRLKIDPPTVLVAGVSSRQHILAIATAPVPERSRNIKPDAHTEEAGGQHLYPALALAQAGHRVALATLIGQDDDGDWILNQARSKASLSTGDLDTNLVIRKHRTRRTFVLTYPVQPPENGWPIDGERQIMDLPERDQPHGDWLDSGDHGDRGRITAYLQLLGNARCLRALYLGAYGPDIQELILKAVGKDTIRVFETGSSGGYDARSRARTKALAAQCTHVVASAAFVYWVTGALATAEESSLMLQRKLPTDVGTLQKARREIFGDRTDCFLIVTLGAQGCAVIGASEHRILPVVRPDDPARTDVKCWLGCGDTFRWAFLNHLLRNESTARSLSTVLQAAEIANAAAVDRTYRVCSLPS